MLGEDQVHRFLDGAPLEDFRGYRPASIRYNFGEPMLSLSELVRVESPVSIGLLGCQ